MTDIESIIAALLIVWIVWNFVVPATLWLIGRFLEFLDRFEP